MVQKVIRSICLFSHNPGPRGLERLAKIADAFGDQDFEVQTKRLCSKDSQSILELDKQNDGNLYSIGELDYNSALKNLDMLVNTNNISFNVNLTDGNITTEHTFLLTEIINRVPQQTFNFTYTFNNLPSSPYFPSAIYERDGFSIGLQPTNLAEGCHTLESWLERVGKVWEEIIGIASREDDFLGIDTSIAPIFSGSGSLVNFVKRLGMNFSESATTSTYFRITDYIKNKCTKPVGLCGLMFPCLEDFELADEYEAGNFSIERNIFLSLHSGLGIDTYPIGIDERPERVAAILQLLQGLSKKYQKPLSARFVSDGDTKIGQKSDFHNKYLKDVIVRAL